MGREEQEAKLQKELDKLRKAAKNKKKTNKAKPLKMDRESVEKRRMEELDRLRKEYKDKKQKKSIAKENEKLSKTRNRSSLDKLEKVSMLGKKKPKTVKVTELKMFKGEMIPKKEYDLIMATRKALGKNKGGIMYGKKKMGYLSGGQTKLDKNKDGKISGADFKMMNRGGMSKKGMSDYRGGGMFYNSKKKK